MENSAKIANLKIKIEQKQGRLNSGTISNPLIIKQAKRDIKRWQEEIKTLSL